MNHLSRRVAIGLGLISGPTTRAALAQENSKPAASEIEVAIAIPIYKGDRLITIGPDRHYHVVITNRLKQPIRLWDEHCSQGEFNLAFEVRVGDDSKFIRRRGQMWAKNFPIALDLHPGDQVVFECSFNPDRWELPWGDFDIGIRRVRMRAVYRIEPSTIAAQKGIWTGEVMSAYHEYLISDNRR